MTMNDLSNELEAFLGIKQNKANQEDFLKKLRKLITDQGWKTPDELAQKLKQKSLSKEQKLLLAREFTIGETYFFRYRASFESLVSNIFPKLIDKKTIRIWSAGCSSGEEPYTLAMILNELGILQNIEILATDINLEVLNKALRKTYSKWSFRGVEEALIAKYFKKEKNKWKFQLKAPIHFKYHNLVTDPYPLGYDLILCNNVLIYFSLEKIQSTIHKFASSLNEGGWLLTSPVENPYVDHPDLKPVKFNEVIFFQKKTTCKEIKKKITVSDFSFPTVQAKASTNDEKEKSWKMRVKTLFDRGQTDEAVEEMEELYQKTSWTEEEIAKYEELIYLTLRCFSNQGELKKADLWCSTFLEVNKTSPTLYFLHGVILQEENKQTEAETAFQNALFLDPTFIMAHFFLGTLKKLQGKKESAERFFDNVLKLLNSQPDTNAIFGTDLSKEQLLHILTQLRSP